jgi:hypothetical protein
MATKKTKLPMGIFEKVPGSGIYWIRFTAEGKIRREKVGSLPQPRTAWDFVTSRQKRANCQIHRSRDNKRSPSPNSSMMPTSTSSRNGLRPTHTTRL